MEELKSEAQFRKAELLILPTVEAIQVLKSNPRQANAILRVTC